MPIAPAPAALADRSGLRPSVIAFLGEPWYRTTGRAIEPPAARTAGRTALAPRCWPHGAGGTVLAARRWRMPSHAGAASREPRAPTPSPEPQPQGPSRHAARRAVAAVAAATPRFPRVEPERGAWRWRVHREGRSDIGGATKASQSGVPGKAASRKDAMVIAGLPLRQRREGVGIPLPAPPRRRSRNGVGASLRNRPWRRIRMRQASPGRADRAMGPAAGHLSSDCGRRDVVGSLAATAGRSRAEAVRYGRRHLSGCPAVAIVPP